MTEPVTNDDESGVTAEEASTSPDGPDEVAPEDAQQPEIGTKESEREDDDASNASDPGETEASGGDVGETTLQQEFDAVTDRHLRLVAEFNNFKRRSEQERLAAWSRAQADLVEKFLDVLDDLHRVADLDLSNATVEAIMEGIDLVERKFVRTISDAGIEMIDPTGEAFDPEHMEAMMRVPAETDEQVDTVAQVFQKGYTLKGILVRPARVSVHTQG